MHERDVRSVSFVRNTERLKTTSFHPWWLAPVRDFLFPNFTSHVGKTKTKPGAGEEKKEKGKKFSIGGLKMEKKKKK
ncbi:hypothetical protein, partial [Escherichia coli]|uniref:hypothetical protein n=1 Tax=Escherichia coli TaxID=562 RepID=UPI001BAFBB65